MQQSRPEIPEPELQELLCVLLFRYETLLPMMDDRMISQLLKSFIFKCIYIKLQKVPQQQVLWSSGMTSRCGRASPGSIPGSATSFSFLFFPSSTSQYFRYNRAVDRGSNTKQPARTTRHRISALSEPFPKSDHPLLLIWACDLVHHWPALFPRCR
ncbi:uncharacterized protein BP01DRAFT_23115 [Aspergillus saccharolyticus JOP 1030-1]|uniref:Uncharacterized protein n=1 Tax=Aspergillus saccharolyticus JOP 1030-1 TaxID=1450539 RepID=A0A319AHM7_9EURO|nr:hypothetical protein BP01DRAFT_23115 [Aspergillus saccharolyticus JOP 1030-1]PYH46112.1 hypothetical protein BP01DRAFT_23115 [Aspergillus saccharolyticus JOP 1030-1]